MFLTIEESYLQGKFEAGHANVETTHINWLNHKYTCQKLKLVSPYSTVESYKPNRLVYRYKKKRSKFPLFSIEDPNIFLFFKRSKYLIFTFFGFSQWCFVWIIPNS